MLSPQPAPSCPVALAFRLSRAYNRALRQQVSHPGKIMEDQLRKAALDYHRLPKPGKISVTATKGLINQRDLALAYTPGVAAACEEIVRDPAEARNLTARGNLVGVITNGTAVLGLGAIGPLAAKPATGGKAVL